MAMSGASLNHSPKPSVSSPWSQIVIAAAPASSPPPPAAATAMVVESSAVAVVNSVPAEGSVTVTESSDNGFVGHNGNGNNGKRPAWSKPSNEASSSGVKPFMGADSWPALSEFTRASVKSPSPSESGKGLMDASTSSSSVPSLQGTGSVLPSTERQVRDNAGTNNMVPYHQKSFKRSNSNPSSKGGLPPQLSAPQGSMAASGSHSPNSSPRDHQPRAEVVSSDHPQQRNSYRNRNGGPHQRGDGAHHHNYGSRRDQDRGNQDWNTHRNFNGRDNYMSPRIVSRFISHPAPPISAHLFPQPPLMRPFGGSIGFPELPPQMLYGPPPPLDLLRGVPFVPPTPIPPHAMFFHALDPQLHSKIVKQIDYYFSIENLVKDGYLRKNMDDQGWVPINLIAGFKKVTQLTDNIHIVLDAVRTSSVVEVQGDKIRRRNDWKRWIMPPTQFPNVTGSQTIGKLADQVQNIALETTNNGGDGRLDVSQNRPFGDLNSQFLISTSEGTSQVGIQVSDPSSSARN